MILTTKRPIASNELKELMRLMYFQETTDRYTNTRLYVNGEFTIIEVEFDEDGNITLL